MRSLHTLSFGVLAAVATLLAVSPETHAPSSLLESVKRNPSEARALCQQFKSFNARGESALSPESIALVAGQRNLSNTDAEIVVTYAIGINCPDVR